MSSYIKLNNVRLDYILKTGSSSIRKFFIQTLRKALKLNLDYNSFNTSFCALKNINLHLKQGDKLGILGRNGAGKSTLLRILADIYSPNSGQTNIKGNISCLFDVNLGLNIEATGYENIITMCIIKGMGRSDAIKTANDVAEFTKLGDFLYKPVRMYSSGMRMKLAFGVATAENPDILLVDEIIGAGDSKFMKKATQRIESLMYNSNILALTSHDNNVIKRFCNKAIILENSEIVYNGNVNDAIDYYQRILFNDKPSQNVKKEHSIEAELEPV